jgi:hypothetical protein
VTAELNYEVANRVEHLGIADCGPFRAASLRPTFLSVGFSVRMFCGSCAKSVLESYAASKLSDGTSVGRPFTSHLRRPLDLFRRETRFVKSPFVGQYDQSFAVVISGRLVKAAGALTRSIPIFALPDRQRSKR